MFQYFLVSILLIIHPVFGDDDWKTIAKTKSSYLIVNSDLSFHDAEDNCRKKGAYLVTIVNRTYQDAVYDAVAATANKTYWIGLTKYFKTGSFRWTSGYEAVAVTYWNESRKDGDCIGIDTSLNSNKSWTAGNCELLRPSICMKDGLPKHIRPLKLKWKAGTCPGNFSRIYNQCYKIVPESQNWHDARKACKRLGQNGDLASILYQDTQNILTALMLNQTVSFWIGLHLVKGGTEHTWTRNNSVAYTNWKANEPNGGSSEMCTMMYYRNKNPGEWNDQDCNSKMGYICESDLQGTTVDKKEENPLFPIDEKECNSGEHSYNDFCYWESKINVTGLDAGEKMCQTKNNGHLVSLHSLYEISYLSAFMVKHGIAKTLLGYKLGMDNNYNHYANATDGFYSGVDILDGIDYNKVKNETCLLANNNRTVNVVTCVTETYTPVCRYPQKNTAIHPIGMNYTCENSWYKVSGGFCMKLFSEAKTFDEAQKDCKSKYSNLASITNIREQTVATQLEKRDPPSKGLWIGLNVLFNSVNKPLYKMAWKDGSGVNFYHFRQGEPSPPKKNGPEECVLIRAKSGDWNNKLCSTKVSYLCKKNVVAVHEPSSTTSPTSTATVITPTATVRANISSNDTTASTTTSMPPTPTTPPSTTKAPTTSSTAKPTTTVITTTTKPKSTLAPCPGYFNETWDKSNCYKVETKKMTWYEANSTCQRKGGNLTSILNSAENDFVKNLVSKSGVAKGLWLGLTDHYSRREGQFEYWSDGQPISIPYFDRNQPESAKGDQDCVAMRSNGYWYMTHCTYKRGFICKWSRTKPKDSRKPRPTINGEYCQAGFHKFRNSCFKLIEKPRMDFANAERQCKLLVDNDHTKAIQAIRKLTSLASVMQYEDNEFLLSLLKPIQGKPAWIGLHYHEKEFHWTDNLPLHYSIWPTNLTYSGENTSCITIGATALQFTQKSGMWYARNCHEKLPYICQMPVSLKKKPDNDDKFRCPKGYAPYRLGGSCYLFDKSKSFDDAKKFCEDEDKKWKKQFPDYRISMLTLTSIYEMSFIRAKLLTKPIARDRPLWLGLKLEKDNSAWKWLTGETVNFTYTNGLAKNQHGCYAFHFDATNHTVYGMQPSKCDVKNTAICKFIKSEKVAAPRNCRTKDSSTYLGHVSHTKSGSSCVRWDMVTDIHLQLALKSAMGSVSDASNFCRYPHLPPKQSHHKFKQPYCYTSVGNTTHLGVTEECDIELCPTSPMAASHGYVVVVAILVIVLLVTISFFVGVMLWRRTNTARGFIPYLRQHDPEGGTSFHNPIYTPAANC